MAVSSSPHTMPPEHLRDQKQRVHISRWHYKKEIAHVGSFPMIVGYSFLKSVINVSSFVDTLSPVTAAVHVVDLILNFLSCTVGTWEFRFISTKHLYLENLSYIKKQQEQTQAQTKQYHQSNPQWKLVLTFW